MDAGVKPIATSMIWMNYSQHPNGGDCLIDKHLKLLLQKHCLANFEVVISVNN